MAFLKILAKTFLGVFLAYGIVFAKELADRGLISKGLGLAGMLCVTAVFLVQRLHSEFPNPAAPHLIKSRDFVMNKFLIGFLREYSAELGSTGRDTPLVRVNIMLVTNRWKGMGGSYLRIYYWAGDVAYSDASRNRRWRRREGTCGWAWRTDEISLYDSVRHPEPESRLRPSEADEIVKTKSVLSVPIRFDDRVVGVLNLDSAEGIERTCFDDQRVVYLAQACASHLAPFCPSAGVRG